ncbi:hypothetical protein vseg_004895 [Gypsophila vaccaria]
MGQHTSCTSKPSKETVKLILQDGSLEEFSYPVKVSHILLTKPNTFICNSDEMEFDVAVTGVRDNDELQLGQLYFALPLSKLNHRLKVEEMVSLAVKANAALLKVGGGKKKCKCRRKTGIYGGGGGGEREWTTWSSSSSKVGDFEHAYVRSGLSPAVSEPTSMRGGLSPVRSGPASLKRMRAERRGRSTVGDLSLIPE